MNYIHKRAYIVVISFIVILITAYPLFAVTRISIIKSDVSDAHNEAIASFIRAITGFGWPYTYNTITIKEGAESEITKQTKGSNLILTIGTTATLAAKNLIKDIPIVFCMVLNPVSNGIVKSMESPGGNITGASLDIPLKTQFEYMKLMDPNIRSIGVIYNPKETGIIVNNAIEVAKRMNINMIAKAITSEQDVPNALKYLSNKIDFLWSVADVTVFGSQSIQYIILNTLKMRIPFMGLSSSFVKAGALMTLSCDYNDIGKQTAEITNRILKGENPKSIPISVPRKTQLWINLRIADQIGLRVPDYAIKSADNIIK